jgi:hypothetical protein
MLHIHHHHHHLSSVAGTIGQFVADVPSRLSLTPHQKTKRKLPYLYVILKVIYYIDYGKEIQDFHNLIQRSQIYYINRSVSR